MTKWEQHKWKVFGLWVGLAIALLVFIGLWQSERTARIEAEATAKTLAMNLEHEKWRGERNCFIATSLFEPMVDTFLILVTEPVEISEPGVTIGSAHDIFDFIVKSGQYHSEVYWDKYSQKVRQFSQARRDSQ